MSPASPRPLFTLYLSTCAVALVLLSCRKDGDTSSAARGPLVGLVTDVGGRGDHSFNDSALRGLELWAAGLKYSAGGYATASPEEVRTTLAGLTERVPPIRALGIRPLVLQSKAQEDYEPNLQLLVDRGARLTIATGFMLEGAVEAVARRNPDKAFLLIDSPLLDKAGNPISLPNVRSVVFREEEGSFLVGALAAMVSKGRLGFVGGMELPLIKRFEAGYKAGARAVRPDASEQVLVGYTGSFDDVGAGKQVALDLLAKGAEVLFHAAGSDGLGVIQAVKEARAQGKDVYVIGVDSDQAHLAPEAVLTSMVKRVDLAVYDSIQELLERQHLAGDRSLGLKEGGVTYAEPRVPLARKDELLAKLEALRARVVSGELAVPRTLEELVAFEGRL